MHLCGASRGMSACLQVDQDVRVGGWIKTGREAGGGSFAFLEVNDGSCLTNLQVTSQPPLCISPITCSLLYALLLLVLPA